MKQSIVPDCREKVSFLPHKGKDSFLSFLHFYGAIRYSRWLSPFSFCRLISKLFLYIACCAVIFLGTYLSFSLLLFLLLSLFG